MLVVDKRVRNNELEGIHEDNSEVREKNRKHSQQSIWKHFGFHITQFHLDRTNAIVTFSTHIQTHVNN